MVDVPHKMICYEFLMKATHEI